MRPDIGRYHLRLAEQNSFGFRVFVVVVAVSSCLATSSAAEVERLADHGWTSPWLISGDEETKGHLIAQQEAKVSGDMALESTGGVGFIRHFPDVTSGILKMEFHIRFRYPTVEVNHPDSSVAKVFIGNKDRDHSFAWRWHTPYAWPRAGGNSLPRFYVGKSGRDFTNFMIEPYTWYKVTTINDLDSLTWEFWVDDVKFDPRRYHGRGVLSMNDTGKLNALTISSRSAGIWFDAFRVWHNGELIAASDFNAEDGYVAGESVIDVPRPVVE